MKLYKGTSHPGKGGGCLQFFWRGSPSVHTVRKLGGERLEGMVWADFGWVRAERRCSCLELWRQGRAAGPSPARSGAFGCAAGS